MNQREAFDDTLALAAKMGMPALPDSSLGFAHMKDMRFRINLDGNFSDAKLGRWLGWAQAALVAANVGVTLEDVKAINRKHSAE